MSTRSASTTAATGGFPLLGVLFCIFVTLKLTGHIAWSWWWVTAPLWGPLALITVIAAIWLVVILLAVAFRQ